MTPGKIIGWKNYGVGVLCILAGLWAFRLGDMDGTVKGILAGLLVISLRDVLGKVLCAIEANRQTMDDLRAAIETELSSRGAL
jgi:hypothetical protein